MCGSTWGLAGEAGVALAGTVVPIQAVDPTAFVAASGPIRATVAFVLVSLLGGILLWRNEPFVDRSVDATLARPLLAIGYGVAAHAVIGFAAFYLASQFALVDVAGWNAGGIGLLIGWLLALSSGALGFTVVGAAVLDVWGVRRNWSGLFVGALIAGVVVLVDPLLAGVVWVAIVSMGIGGPVRKWLHASTVGDV